MNNNIIKALSCLIGSNCLVSTPEAFYIGERGWLSEAIIIKALELKTDMMQVDIEVLRSDKDEILSRLSATENTAINAQSVGENNFDSITILQGILAEINSKVLKNTTDITENALKIDVLAESLYTTMLELERLVSDQHLLTIKVDNLQIASMHTGTKAGEDLTLGKEYQVFVENSSKPQGTIVRFVLPLGSSIYKTTGVVKLDSSGVIGVAVSGKAATKYYNNSFALIEKTVEVGTNIGYFLGSFPEYGEEYKVRDLEGYIIGTITVYDNNKGFRTTGWAALSGSGSSVVISSGLLKEKYYDSNGTEVTW